RGHAGGQPPDPRQPDRAGRWRADRLAGRWPRGDRAGGAAGAHDRARPGDRRRGRPAERLLHRPVHGDRRALHDLGGGGRALDPAGRVQRLRPRWAHGVLAARAHRDGAPRRAPAARIPLHGRGQLRHLDPVRLLVSGAAGMLGLDVLRAGARAGHELIGLTRAELDITEPAAVEEAFARVLSDLGSVEAVLNCAAWTDVDGAESHREQAHAINADGAGNLARASAAAGARLVHVSSDYVFDGEAPRDRAGAPRAYVESDPTGPRSVYGASKLAGEQQVLAASPRHTVVRSSWLFGVGGRNFAETMLRLAGEREEVQVVSDQVGCPTWTGHLAPALLGLIEREVSGLVHLAGGG